MSNLPAPPTTSRVRKLLIAVAGIGILARLAVLPFTAGMDLRIGDERHYDKLATSLVDGRGFSSPSGPTSLRPPLYPAFVAGVWTVTRSRSLQAVRVAQIGLALATTLLVFATARELFGDQAGLYAAALVTFYPGLALFDYLILSEALFATLVAAAAWAYVRMFSRSSVAASVAAGVLTSLAALTRSVVYPVPIVMAAIAMTSARASLPKRVVLAVCLLVAAGATLTPWAIRNTRLQGVPVLVDTMGGMNMRMGNYEFTPLDRMWDAVSVGGSRSWIIGLPEAPPGGGDWNEGQKDRWGRQQAIRFVLAHPGLTAWRDLVKFGDFWGLERDFVAGVEQGLFNPPRGVAILLGSAITLAYPLVLGLTIFGLGRLNRGNWPDAWVPLVMTLFVCALHTLVFGHPRYRVPLTPLMAVYAGAAIDARAWRAASGVWASRAIPATAAMAFCALWVVQFVWRDWPHVHHLLIAAGLA